ncbi:hypothetical protein NIES4074_53130 [Cylindrospermum sp. NIES-4074]|nr:hypothetical protein NIES4074_53130 [Cylindrospermum sp. NIES-4074]
MPAATSSLRDAARVRRTEETSAQTLRKIQNSK